MADINQCPPLTRASVQEAAKRISSHIHRTPLMTSAYIDTLASTPQTPEALNGTEWEGQVPATPQLHIMFKCENFQRVGAFKPRGAFNALLRFIEDRGKDRSENAGPSSVHRNPKPIRIISHSSGNHAQAVSLAARELGLLPAQIVMPAISTPAKIAATQGYGAKVHFSGPTPPERLAVVDELLSDDRYENVFVPPYDHPDTICGQGTVGLEIQDQFFAVEGAGKKQIPPQHLDGIMTPCGGGGLLSGVALSCEGSGISVFGAEPSFEGADDCRRGLEQEKRVESVRSRTVADGLRTPVGEIPWQVISNRTDDDGKLVSGVYAVTEEQIRAAWRLVLERMKILVEPSSVVPLAVALYNEDFRRFVANKSSGWGRTEVFNLAVVVTGGNVNLDDIQNLLG